MSRAGVPVNGSSAITAVDQVTFTPSALPLPDGVYTVDFSGVISVTGGPVAPPTTISFTVDTTGPTVVSSTPSAGQTGVSPDTTITLNFSESLMEENLPFVPLLIGPAEMVALEVISAVGTTYTYRPTTQLTRGATYTVDYSAAFDLLGNPATPPASFSFTVAPPPSPTLVSSSPTAGQQNVAPDTTIELRFSKEMNATASVVLRCPMAERFPAQYFRRTIRRFFSLFPPRRLPTQTTYTVNFSQARDIDGLTPTGATSFTFQTLPPPAFTLNIQPAGERPAKCSRQHSHHARFQQ
jgi:methionine-rich copper-binding protein CopC